MASILSADHGDANTTLIYTGRPLRVRQTDYVKSWNGRQDEMYVQEWGAYTSLSC